MKGLSRILLLILPALLILSCEPQEIVVPPEGDQGLPETAEIPEIHISVSLAEWNRLLALYDNYYKTKQYIKCDATYIDSEGSVTVRGAGLRLRGNTSRRRPESAPTHQAGKTDWHHCHFGLNFQEYTKDAAHQVRDIRKINLKWFKDDGNYVREVFCYDLFRRYGIWTAPHSSYCRLWLKVEGDPKETYFGVYELLEPVDKRFLKAREGFGSPDGNLWKCRGGAGLNTLNTSFGRDDGSDAEYVYEYKGSAEKYEGARAQLQDFILKLTGKGEDSFYKWIQEVCDVPLLLRTYAVNVTVGMWDDYWRNSNNYYIYFNTTDKFAYKFFFIPFDYDNTLGTSLEMEDAGIQDPFHWGREENPLIGRLLRFEDFRQIYKEALLELVDPDKALFYYTASMQRIRDWQDSIREYIPNDTGEDCEIRDEPAYWGNQHRYRLLTTGPDNFFQVKTQTILKYCNQ